jgi:hypothetical protein
MKIKTLTFINLFMIMIISSPVFNQNAGIFSGGLQSNFNFFMRDSLIGASGIPQYDRLLYGTENWLNLNYIYDTWEMGLRFDVFNNSNLRDPNSAYSDQGLGNWYVKKSVDNLEISGGYLYDQIGSGTIFRAYEERPLFIDNSLYGVRLKYNFTNDLNARLFTGRQKNIFSTYPAIIRGGSVEWFVSAGEEKPLTIAPGAGFVARTHDESTINSLVNTIRTYLPAEQVLPQYNTYLGTIYSLFSYDAFSWYIEGSYKSPEVFFNPDARLLEPSGDFSNGKFEKKAGSVFYSTLSYAKNKLGIAAEFKRTENFDFRTDPTFRLNDGVINFVPPMSKLNTYTLTARYNPATQLLSEYAYQLDVKYRLNRQLSFNAYFSNIFTLGHDQLYQEFFTEFLYTRARKLRLTGGFQYQKYNQPVYEGEGSEILTAYTPFIDLMYRINRRTSIKTEIQYMHTKQDYGSWINIFAELSRSPNWSLEAAAMYNVVPADQAPKDENGNFRKIIYPAIGVTYTKGPNRFSLRYAKQVRGVVCSGGVCRVEPAFSGVRFNVASRF